MMVKTHYLQRGFACVIFLTLKAISVSSYDCYIGQDAIQTSPNERYTFKWAMKGDKQYWCKCTELIVGGINVKESRTERTKYMERFPTLKRIREMFECPEMPIEELTPTTQAATTQPATTQPATTQPATTQPATTQPARTQPPTTQSATTQPPTTQPPTTQPPTTQPPTTQPHSTAEPLVTVDMFDAASLTCPTLEAHQSFTDCQAVYDSGYTTSGVYVLDLASLGLYRAYCEMATSTNNVGGWLMIQRRVDGTQNFYQTKETYLVGFGNLCVEFYWGNTNINTIIDSAKWKLQVHLGSFEGEVTYRYYTEFKLDKGEMHIQISGTTGGTADDGLTELHDKKFTTYNSDKDDDNRNLAAVYQTGWWFSVKDESETPISNLNGKYYTPSETREAWQGIIWVHDNPMKNTTMRIKAPDPKK